MFYLFLLLLPTLSLAASGPVQVIQKLPLRSLYRLQAGPSFSFETVDLASTSGNSQISSSFNSSLNWGAGLQGSYFRAENFAFEAMLGFDRKTYIPSSGGLVNKSKTLTRYGVGTWYRYHPLASLITQLNYQKETFFFATTSDLFLQTASVWAPSIEADVLFYTQGSFSLKAFAQVQLALPSSTEQQDTKLSWASSGGIKMARQFGINYLWHNRLAFKYFSKRSQFFKQSDAQVLFTFSVAQDLDRLFRP